MSPTKRRRLDRELVAGASAHYEDAAYYAHAYGRRIDDVQMYVSIALASGGPVLEYGIGNGRIALPLARHGVSVIGVDRSSAMLTDLRRRLRSEPTAVRSRVAIVPGDMRRVRMARRFPLVIAPFNTILHLYDRADVESFFAAVRRHLAKGGTFVADLSIPIPKDLAREPGRPFRTPRFRHPSMGVVRYEERFDYDRVRQILFVSMNFDPVGEGATGSMVPLAHRQFYPQEFEALLHYNGFDVTHVFGDFHGGPLDAASDVMVWHAKVHK